MPEAVIVVPYDADWPSQFERECAILSMVFSGTDAVIEHVGSTAVPGLGAKPVIDILVGLSRVADAESRSSQLGAQGYEYVRQYEAQLPDRRYYRKPRFGPRAYHLHCVVRGGDFWIRHIAFRDYLRAHPESAAAYFELKRELAARCGKGAYTEAKSPFIEDVLSRALSGGHQRTAQQRVAPDGR